MYLTDVQSCLQLVFTYATPSTCFKRIAAPNTVLFACLCLKNKSTFESYLQFLNCTRPTIHKIWLAFENLLVLISSKLHSKCLISYTNCCENYFNKFHLE